MPENNLILPRIGIHLEDRVEAILSGASFFSNEQGDGKLVGLPVAFQEALTYATPEGIVATMPELIATKIKAPKEHDFWKKWHTVHTEEDSGIDKKGFYYKKDEPVVVIVNGCGILTPERIRKAYTEGLIDHSAEYTDTEFDHLLEGNLPDGTRVELYKLEDLQTGNVIHLPHRFGVVLPYKIAQGTVSGLQKNICNNPLALARAGSLENLEKYYNLAKDSSDQLGNWHVYGTNRDPKQPQGRMLFLSSDSGGLGGGDDLDGGGRFVGVAPEAHRARSLSASQEKKETRKSNTWPGDFPPGNDKLRLIEMG